MLLLLKLCKYPVTSKNNPSFYMSMYFQIIFTFQYYYINHTVEKDGTISCVLEILSPSMRACQVKEQRCSIRNSELHIPDQNALVPMLVFACPTENRHISPYLDLVVYAPCYQSRVTDSVA